MNFDSTQRQLRDLVRDFNNGSILLPQFQRDYVWKVTKIRNLARLSAQGFPIGGVYLWRPRNATVDAKPKGFGNQSFASEPQAYLIDGQQRLTSLEAAFGLYIGEDKRGEELRCFLDLSAHVVSAARARDTKLFVSYAGNKTVARRYDAGDSTLIPIERFFNGAAPDLRAETEVALKAIPWDNDRIVVALHRFDQACEMLNQSVPCTTITEVSDEEAVEIFSRFKQGRGRT